MVTVATLTSLTQGDIPETVYSNVEVVAPAVGTNVPATALKIPPVPVPVRVQTPPVCSPVIKLNKSIGVVVLAQITVPPSVPAVGCGIIVTVATLVSLAQGVIPVIVYVKVEVVAPTAGVYVPATASKTPPVPVPVCVQTPPDCSPEIKLNKFIVDALVSQTVILPSRPALDKTLTCKTKEVVAKIVAFELSVILT